MKTMTDNLTETRKLKDSTASLKAISSAVLKFRKGMKLTQNDLAEKIGKSRLFIVELEAGEKDPTISTLYDLAEVFGCALTDLVPQEKLDEPLVEMRGEKISSDSEKQVKDLLKALKLNGGGN